MKTLIEQLNAMMKDALLKEGITDDLSSQNLVKASDRPDLSDYQSTVCLSLAKKEKKNPIEVANKVIAHLKTVSIFDVFVAGPGFVNFKFRDSFLLEGLNKGIEKPKAKPPQNIIVDYGGPNVAKPMHIGHLRSSIIGESIKRLALYLGHKVLGDIHMGDWGTQMGMLIVGIQEKSPQLCYFDPAFEGHYPEHSPVTLDDLQELYPQMSARCKEDEALSEKARLATYELQSGRRGYRALWQHFVDISVSDMKQNFSKLNVSFDQWFGESRYQDKIPAMIDDYARRGIVEKSQGALIINVSESEDKKEMPPLILQKKDGGFLYATTDLATIEERVNLFGCDRAIYVVDGRQSLHFEQVFRAARKAGHKIELDFIGFGTMNGSDNKPFKTRSGGAMRLEDLIEMLTTEAKSRIEAAEKTKGYEEFEIDSISRAIGIAALKFADLQHNPTQNYQFDLKKFMAFEGKTGPYLLYAIVRIVALLSKAEEAKFDFKNCELSPLERNLLLKLMQKEEVINRAYEALSPHYLCDYAFDLAQAFSSFYAGHSIFSEPDTNQKNFRLFLCQNIEVCLRDILNLLGIEPVEKM